MKQAPSELQQNVPTSAIKNLSLASVKFQLASSNFVPMI